MCRGWLPLCHGSRLVRALRAIEAVGQTSAIPPALALPRPGSGAAICAGTSADSGILSGT